MKHICLLVLVLLVVPAMGLWSEEVYCRYQNGTDVSYGRVDGDTIHSLNAAPWAGGKETGQSIGIKEVKLLHPSEPQKIIGISGSYKEAWAGGKKPFNTIRWFLKPPTSAASPGEAVVLPAAVDLLLAEVEVVVVIGKPVKNASIEEAKEAIFGYCVGNDLVGDVTAYHRIQGESDAQVETLLPPGLKMGDGFAPYGPYIYRGLDWKNRERTLTVTNSKTNMKQVYQHNTSNMIFPPEKIVSDLSRVFSLNPGDVIFTGTTGVVPAQAGDVMEVSVEGLGSLINPVKAAE